MNAEQLTKRYNEQRVRIDDLEKRVEYLEQELNKLRTLYSDLKIDFMIEKGRATE